MPQEVYIIERLLKAGDPQERKNWQDHDGCYITACEVTTDDVDDLIEIARNWSQGDWFDSTAPLDAAVDVRLLPVTAWRALADLKAGAAVQPLIDMLLELNDQYDDWTQEELPHVFGKIGESAIKPLTDLAEDVHSPEFMRCLAVTGLCCVATYHPETRERLVTLQIGMLDAARADDLQLNTTLMYDLVELQAVEAAESIERAFAGNLLDVGMLGDWEDVRRKLGVAGLGLEMPENPFNSLDDFRLRMGIGIFSDKPVFLPEGDRDDDAAEAYYQRAFDTFSRSPEGQQAYELYGRLGRTSSLLIFGVDYLGVIVDEMTPGSLMEYVLEYVPRKLSTDPEEAESIIGELTLFWEFLDRVYQLPAADLNVKWLRTEGLVETLTEKLSDPSNFGMAKSFVMQGENAGFDMSTEEGMAAFMPFYNQSLLVNRLGGETQRFGELLQDMMVEGQSAAPQPRLASQKRVGRNEPCPCGSGKKFKKCCG